MSEAQTVDAFDITQLNFSPALIEDIEAIEPDTGKEDSASTQSNASDAGVKGEMTAEAFVELVEVGFQSFVVEDFALPAQRKALIIKNFTPYFAKHDGSLINKLGAYKEEGQALFALAILAFILWRALKVASAEKANAEKETSEHAHGDKQQSTPQGEA
ncbi:hypothetical protein [Enterovibrio coralii]|uniref:Uncharacterized protein n=1 Tax=Enterovibrio coralii TaxID=294935 RepID=A0A135I6Z1_9GAMM|nr:hypothetical protein [Enterovibrio coralii]KXF81208.1 hypothetical protein ATN88_00090 [Enterovibrio coralii]